MTRRHFRRLAKELAAVRPPANESRTYAGWRQAVDAVAETCLAFNPDFDWVRFVEACMAED